MGRNRRKGGAGAVATAPQEQDPNKVPLPGWEVSATGLAVEKRLPNGGRISILLEPFYNNFTVNGVYTPPKGRAKYFFINAPNLFDFAADEANWKDITQRAENWASENIRGYDSLRTQPTALPEPAPTPAPTPAPAVGRVDAGAFAPPEPVVGGTYGGAYGDTIPTTKYLNDEIGKITDAIKTRVSRAGGNAQRARRVPNPQGLVNDLAIIRRMTELSGLAKKVGDIERRIQRLERQATSTFSQPRQSTALNRLRAEVVRARMDFQNRAKAPLNNDLRRAQQRVTIVSQLVDSRIIEDTNEVMRELFRDLFTN